MSYPYFTLESLNELIRRILGIRAEVRLNETNINSVLNRMDLLSRRLETVESMSNIKFIDDTNVEDVYINTDKNLVVAGLTMTNLVDPSWALIAPSIQLTNSTANSVSVTTTATDGDITIDGLNTSGTLAKAVSNAAIKVNTNEDVVIKNCTIGQNGYNAIEIGLGSTSPKNITIEDCEFEGTLGNNAISIFDTADNANINITNCHFTDTSNVLRISNRSNASDIVITFTNCSWDKLESDLTYKAVVICQDYTSATGAEALSANRFGNDKITINFINCTGEDGELIEEPELHTDGYGTGLGKLIYVYMNKWGDENTASKVEYSSETANLFPKFGIITGDVTDPTTDEMISDGTVITE